MNENEISGIYLFIGFLKLFSMYWYWFLFYVLLCKFNCRFKCDIDNDCGDGFDEGEFCGKIIGNIICIFYYGCFLYIFKFKVLMCKEVVCRDYRLLILLRNFFILFYYFFCKVFIFVMWIIFSVGISDVYILGSFVTVRRIVTMDSTRRIVFFYSVRTVNGFVKRGDSVYLKGIIVTGF